MKYTNLEYQRKALNRLANMAYRKGGTDYMRTSLERATSKIWGILDSVYGRLPEITRHAWNVRNTI